MFLENFYKDKKKLIISGLFLIVFIIAIIILFRFKPWEKQKAAEAETAPLFTSNEEIITITLFFSSEDDKDFVIESREIFKTKSIVNQAKQAILKLIEGPTTEEAATVISLGTKLRELYLENGHAYVDFSKEISENHPGGSKSEISTINSIVNTLIRNFSEIKDVQILIEGKVAETLAGHIDISQPFKEKIEKTKINN